MRHLSRFVEVSFMRVALALGLATAVGAAPLLAQRPKPTAPRSTASRLITADLDTTCAACRDFYQFANGGWIKHTQVPANQRSWSLMQEMREVTLLRRHTLLDTLASHLPELTDPLERSLGQFFTTCTDTARIEARGASPLTGPLKHIAALTT